MGSTATLYNIQAQALITEVGCCFFALDLFNTCHLWLARTRSEEPINRKLRSGVRTFSVLAQLSTAIKVLSEELRSMSTLVWYQHQKDYTSFFGRRASSN